MKTYGQAGWYRGETIVYGPYDVDLIMEILVDQFTSELSDNVNIEYVWSANYKFSAVMACYHSVNDTMVDILYVGEYTPSPIVAPLVDELLGIG